MIRARSAAVVWWSPPASEASRPFGVTKCVSVQPIAAAFSFISAAKPSMLPPMVSAIITAASLCDSSIREYNRSPSRNCSPSYTPRWTFGAAAAWADAVATVSSSPFSSARMHVIILVVLAIAIGSVSRFPKSTRPVSPSIRHAAVANS